MDAGRTVRAESHVPVGYPVLRLTTAVAAAYGFDSAEISVVIPPIRPAQFQPAPLGDLARGPFTDRADSKRATHMQFVVQWFPKQQVVQVSILPSMVMVCVVQAA